MERWGRGSIATRDKTVVLPAGPFNTAVLVKNIYVRVAPESEGLGQLTSTANSGRSSVVGRLAIRADEVLFGFDVSGIENRQYIASMHYCVVGFELLLISCAGITMHGNDL